MADNSPIANSSSEGDSPKAGHTGPNPTPSIIDFLTMGVSIALCLVLGGGIGYGIDALVGTSPILTFVGLAFGVAAAVLVTITLVRKYL
ncbi:MAG TPA: AtpZ/AtpI family protein [Acidimicrobiales bacterium]|jgi:F0F1-type ATP synthase assembly protein I